MKKLCSAVALAALAAFMTTTAFAADPEPMPAAANWTGFHVGIGGGGNFAFADDEANAYYNDSWNNSLYAEGSSSADLGKAGAFGTVEAGYDYQMEQVVFGVLANYDFGKTKMKSHGESYVNDCANGCDNESWSNFDSTVEVGDSWAVGLRLGWLATDSTLIYALGGYTQAKIKQSADLYGYSNVNYGSFGVGDSSSGWEDGYFVGAGIETMFTDSITLKGEYRFSDFGKVNSDYDYCSGNFCEGVSHSSDVTVHSVRAVLSFRF